jgi:Transglutaminase-like superfamily
MSCSAIGQRYAELVRPPDSIRRVSRTVAPNWSSNRWTQRCTLVVVGVGFFAEAGPFTGLSGDQSERIRSLSFGPEDLCRVAQSLLVSPPDAVGAGLTEARLVERNTRPASALFGRALELDPGIPLGAERPAERRVVGTCRHFAVLATAFLRAIAVPARGRCGFATYFVPARKVDHWIVEYWSDRQDRWIRADPEYLDRPTPGTARTEDLRPGEFLTAGEAWQFVRSGQEDPIEFGVFGTENWGAGEIRGNAMRDLASLARKIEMLPWDEWGPMEASYNNETGPGFDLLIDQLAVATADPEHADLEAIYDRLAVPESMIC